MKLALDCIVFGLQRRGGVSNYWQRLILYAIGMPGVELSLCLPRKIIAANATVSLYRNSFCRSENLPAFISRFRDSSFLGRSDIFHSSYYRSPHAEAHPYVITVYDCIYERYRKGIARSVHLLQKKRCIERADAVICISNSTRNDVLEFYPGVQSDRIHVIPLGVDSSLFRPLATPQANVVSNLVLFVGLRRAAYKRFDLAIDAVRLSSPELQLGIVGECLTPPEIELLNAKLNHRWSYLGAVADAKLRELYSASHALIYPSDFEGFGLPVLEAMSCGCPVIAFGSSSLPEVGGDAALYALNQDPFEYSLLLNSLLSPDCRRAAMLQGLQRVKSFDWEVVFDKTFALYRSLI